MAEARRAADEPPRSPRGRSPPAWRFFAALAPEGARTGVAQVRVDQLQLELPGRLARPTAMAGYRSATSDTDFVTDGPFELLGVSPFLEADLVPDRA